jgi:hypothetical protein
MSAGGGAKGPLDRGHMIDLEKERIHFRSASEDGVQVKCQLGEEQKGVSPSHFYSLSPLFIDLDILVSLGMTQGQGQ